MTEDLTPRGSRIWDACRMLMARADNDAIALAT
jgi:hypothetical protein